jgi:hypothetical protein
MSNVNLSMVATALFEQIEKINNGNLSADALDEQLKKGAAIVVLSKTIIDANRLALDALKAQGDLIESMSLPKSLMIDHD